jgi:acyl carrier protein
MENLKKYNQVFMDTLGIKVSELQNLSYHDNAAWDSVNHMAIVAALEEAFDIMMETDDIIDLSSYQKGIAILKNKYDIEF